jgi:hypothetical protein
VSAKPIFNAALTSEFKATKPFLMNAGRVTLDFTIDVTEGGSEEVPTSQIEWYLEFTSADPNAVDTEWFREVAEQNLPGPGTTNMPMVVRIFNKADGTLLTVGTYSLSTQLTRSHDYCRAQIRAATGEATAIIRSVFGGDALSPTLS